MKRACLRFNVADWSSDIELHACGLAARSIWIEMLCLMTTSRRFGYYLTEKGQPVSLGILISRCAAPEAEVSTGVEELERHGVFSRDEAGVIYCRRMVREEEHRQRDRDRKRKCKEADGMAAETVRNARGIAAESARNICEEGAQPLLIQSGTRKNSAAESARKVNGKCAEPLRRENPVARVFAAAAGVPEGCFKPAAAKNPPQPPLSPPIVPPALPRIVPMRRHGPPGAAAETRPEAFARAELCPKAREFVAGRFPDVTASFLSRLWAAAEAIEPQLTDETLHEALSAVWELNRRRQLTAGLFLTTVPGYLANCRAAPVRKPPAVETQESHEAWLASLSEEDRAFLSRAVDRSEQMAAGGRSR